MVEPRRKHGSFDPRYPTLSTPATPTWVLRADAGLDWTEFLTRFFPGRRRHDIEALAAYGSGLERRASTSGNRYSVEVKQDKRPATRLTAMKDEMNGDAGVRSGSAEER
jgi:hypothetical protein